MKLRLAILTALMGSLAAASAPAGSLAGKATQTVPAAASLKAAGYVDDFAHVLSPDAAAALDQRATVLDHQLHVQIAMVTLPTIGDQDIQTYSYDLAEHWGVGRKSAPSGDKDTGLLIFVAVNDHKYFTQVGYGLEPYITDADVGTWMRALRPQLQQADFGAVFSGMLDQIEQTLAQRMPGAAAQLGQLPASNAVGESGGERRRGGSPVGMGFVILIWIVIALFSRGRGGGCLWPLLFMGGMGGGGRGGGGWGGGFGGGGGGGFGGFGGGGFGGGGAGGSW